MDGGSESVAAFKEECETLGLPLLALPPRAECWSQCHGELTCAAMNEALTLYLDYCNNRHPHREGGGFIKVQGTAEGAPFGREALADMLALAECGIGELFVAQRRALGLADAP